MLTKISSFLRPISILTLSCVVSCGSPSASGGGVPTTESQGAKTNDTAQGRFIWLPEKLFSFELPEGSFADTANGVPFKMIFVEGGKFVMGDQFGEGEPDEKPHPVSMSSYFIGQTEVTQRLWEAVMGNNPSYYSDCPDCPVEQICWQDAQVFLKKLNLLTGKKYRLPTEAEWEFAARERGKKIRFANGRDTARDDQINFDALQNSDLPYAPKGIFRDRTTPVMSFPPNSLGIFDMSGNVWEFCSDWYGEYVGKQDPTGPKTGTYKVFRGGSWANGAEYNRCSSRENNAVGGRLDIYGMRLAQSAD